ncbi:RNA methyltransferase, TrmH family [Terribacillus halophilus]|uniref:RNA methyltransferase, TrmH family n=1 Tax=Terribacillus halophilus TaxID=361279 RepID=A0A1G6UHM6_9BACI|nr:RNA methyltransferase [Terribacillus halophilus]SDD40771.1 RNA methyltransferase, TrmH family [Terribacillus halophilus]
MITSTQNAQVKQWQKLKRKKERTKTNTFIIEGFHLVEEAIESGWTIDQIILREETELPEWAEHLEPIRVSDHVFKSITETETPQGIAAVVQMQDKKLKRHNRILLLDAVQDPGNLGTIIRTADAAGYDAVYVGEGSADRYNDKVIRATQGSIFHLPVLTADLALLLPELQENGYTVWAAALEGAVDYRDLTAPEKTALLVGNEGAGIDKRLIAQSDMAVKIPIFGKAESLNVSIATGILLYHTVNR